MINYRTLTDDDYPEIFETMDEAFSDYSVKMKMDTNTYRKRLEVEGVKFEHSVGAFYGEKLVGATMNGIGYWNGIPAVHDAGTGVIPDYRRKGVSSGMFNFIIPHLKENGFVRYSLEVIIGNDGALKLYKGLGFEISREFVIYESRGNLDIAKRDEGGEVKRIEYPDWDKLRQFWTFEPSWQNSIDCTKRAMIINSKSGILGIFKDDELIGYAAVFEDSGKVSQIAIAEKYRRQGYGKILLTRVSEFSTKPLLMTNIDKEATGAIALLESCGFSNTLEQYEMLLSL